MHKSTGNRNRNNVLQSSLITNLVEIWLEKKRTKDKLKTLISIIHVHQASVTKLSIILYPQSKQHHLYTPRFKYINIPYSKHLITRHIDDATKEPRSQLS